MAIFSGHTVQFTRHKQQLMTDCKRLVRLRKRNGTDSEREKNLSLLLQMLKWAKPFSLVEEKRFAAVA